MSCRETRQPGPAGPSCVVVLGQVDAGEDADWNRHQRCDADQDAGADQRVCNTRPRNADRPLDVGEELWMQDRGKTFRCGEPENEAQRDEGQHGEDVHDADRGPAHVAAACASAHTATLLCAERTNSRAKRLTVSVTRMRTRPSSISTAG